jgi:hypothetical protein
VTFPTVCAGSFNLGITEVMCDDVMFKIITHRHRQLSNVRFLHGNKVNVLVGLSLYETGL